MFYEYVNDASRSCKVDDESSVIASGQTDPAYKPSASPSKKVMVNFEYTSKEDMKKVPDTARTSPGKWK